MKAGRELDALVAEKVMGRELNLIPKSDYDRLFETGRISCSYEDFLDMQDIWSPSTDIAAAWEVVTHLRERKLRFDLHVGTSGRAIVEFSRNGGQGVDISGDDAPHAICLAALESVGFEL